MEDWWLGEDREEGETRDGTQQQRPDPHQLASGSGPPERRQSYDRHLIKLQPLLAWINAYSTKK